MSSPQTHISTSGWLVATHIIAKSRFLIVKCSASDDSAQRKVILRNGPANLKNIYTRAVEGRQVSQAIIPEIHSQRERCSQSPNPPALSYPVQTGVLAVSTLDYHDAHVC